MEASATPFLREETINVVGAPPSSSHNTHILTRSPHVGGGGQKVVLGTETSSKHRFVTSFVGRSQALSPLGTALSLSRLLSPSRPQSCGLGLACKHSPSQPALLHGRPTGGHAKEARDERRHSVHYQPRHQHLRVLGHQRPGASSRTT
jgi:hypothetical protein